MPLKCRHLLDSYIHAKAVTTTTLFMLCSKALHWPFLTEKCWSVFSLRTELGLATYSYYTTKSFILNQDCIMDLNQILLQIHIGMALQSVSDIWGRSMIRIF